MQKTANNRSQNPDSYDIWENGCRNYLKRSSATLQNIESLPLIPYRVMDVTRIDNCWFQHVNYQYMALELILNGTAEYQTEYETLIAPPGMLYVVARGSNVRMVNSGKSQLRKLCILIGGSCLDSLADSQGFSSDCLLKLSAPKQVEQMIREIARGIVEQKSHEYLSVKCYELLLFLKKDLPQEPAELRPLLNWISQNPAAKISIPEMAKKCGLSESALRRKFYDFFQMSPSCYLQQRRLLLGRELLKGKMSIKEIATKSGFSSPLRFTLAYKKFYGESPSDTRRKAGKISKQ